MDRFFLAQLLANAEYFRPHLNKVRKIRNARFLLYRFDKDDTQHTFVICERWIAERSPVETFLASITPDNKSHQITNFGFNQTMVVKASR